MWLLGGVPGMVLDIGQSALKITTSEGHKWWFPRNYWTLPLAVSGMKKNLLTRHRRAFVNFIGSKSAAAAKYMKRVEKLVIALPAVVSEDGSPALCSYAGIAGDSSLVADIRNAAGLRSAETIVVNDAELAAVSAALDRRSQQHNHVLTVTFGFSIGAALIAPETFLRDTPSQLSSAHDPA